MVLQESGLICGQESRREPFAFKGCVGTVWKKLL